MNGIRTMRSLLILAVLLSLFATAAFAQSSLKLTSTKKSFQSFYIKFKNAVNRGDKEAVAALTRFPFKYGFDAGDEGTFSRAEFLEKFADIFGGDRKIFTRKNPLFYFEAGSYDLTDIDDASHFIFTKTGSSYKLTAYIAEP